MLCLEGFLLECLRERREGSERVRGGQGWHRGREEEVRRI